MDRTVRGGSGAITAGVPVALAGAAAFAAFAGAAGFGSAGAFTAFAGAAGLGSAAAVDEDAFALPLARCLAFFLCRFLGSPLFLELNRRETLKLIDLLT